jgi:hypothetical protein
MEQVQGVAATVTEPGCTGSAYAAPADAVVWAEGVAGPRQREVPGVRRVLGERGMVSAEWAVGIVAAVAIAGVLLAVVTTGAVQKMLLSIVLTVLKTFTKFAG